MRSLRAPVHRLGVFCLLLSCLHLPAAGQVNPALTVSSSSGAPGANVLLNISLSGGSSLPASLEWTFRYPNDFSAASFNVGASALSAGKFVSCNGSAGAVKCIVWGPNASTISDGIIATVSLALGSTANSAAQVGIGDAAAADANGVAIPLTGGAGTVSIAQNAILSGISCTATALLYPAEIACTVLLSAPAPSDGAAVALSVSPASATVDSLLVIPEGSSVGTFSVAAQEGAPTTQATLMATYQGSKQSVALTINPWRPKKRIIPLK